MFTIGLEISFQRLRRMAKQVFGVGMAQVLLTSAGFYLAARAMGLSNEASLLVGGALSLSSTAFVVRLLAERGALQSRQGRLVFSTLLFQDLAVAPNAGRSAADCCRRRGGNAWGWRDSAGAWVGAWWRSSASLGSGGMPCARC